MIGRPWWLNVLIILLLVYVGYTDYRTRRIPNRITYPAVIAGLVLALVCKPGLQNGLVGAIVGGGVFLIPVLIFGPDRAGMGDVKLGIVIGILLGFPRILLALSIAFGASLWVIVPLLLLRKVDRRSLLPFGPFLATGGIVGLLLSGLG